MIRHLRSAAAVLAISLGTVVPVLALGPAASAQSPDAAGLEIQNVDASGFPLVRAVVSGPTVTGDPDGAFTVVEDGEELTVDVQRLRSDELNVAVALDVSGSMKGEPIERAKAAIGELLANLPAEVPVSIVSFGEQAVVTQDFSTDRAAIQAQVDALIAAGGSKLFDGIDRSLAQLAARGGRSALVVLADGADSGSETTLAAITERLAGTEVAASFVALKTDDLDPATFATLADAATGNVVTVEQTAQLTDAFGRIAAGLSSSFELRWTSGSTGEAGEVTIGLTADPSVTATATFAHDAVRQFVPDIADDVRVVPDAGIFSSSFVPVAAALGVSLGGFLLVMLLRTSEGATERREERKAERDFMKQDRKRRVSGVQEKLNDLSAQVLQSQGKDRSLDDTLDRAGLAMRSNEFVVLCAGIVGGSLLVGVLLFGIPFFLLMGLLPAAGIPMFLKFKISRRRKKFVAQLGDTLQLMAGSLTAGYGLGQALDSVARETDAPTSEEFQRVVMETRLGRSLEDALDAMSYRIGAKDFDWVVDAIKIQASVGGNLSEIIAQVGETIRARTRIRRQVDALTAEGKISALVLYTLPFGLFGFIWSSNPDYINPMFSSGIGQVMLGVALTMLSIGGLWLKKLVNPEF